MGYWLADAEQRKWYRINQNRAERGLSEAKDFRSRRTLKETVRAIQRLVSHQAKFWSKAHGWAHKPAAELLSSIRLEWYASLALNLDLTLRRPIGPEERQAGRLIIGWAHLGSLLECTLQLFLGVWLRDYLKDGNRVIDKRNPAKPRLLLPQDLMLESLRVYFDKSIWDEDEKERWGKWILHVQQRRNAIHALKPRGIGTWHELEESVGKYLDFLEELDVRLPEPDPGMESNEP